MQVHGWINSSLSSKSVMVAPEDLELKAIQTVRKIEAVCFSEAWTNTSRTLLSRPMSASWISTLTPKPRTLASLKRKIFHVAPKIIALSSVKQARHQAGKERTL